MEKNYRDSTFFELIRAQSFAQTQHRDQVRKDGTPYIQHIYDVVDMLESTTLKVVGYLHDLVEDTDTTLEEIEEYFGIQVRDLVDAMTHREGESYKEYIFRIKTKGQKAIIVKRADILDNLLDCLRPDGTIKPELESLAVRYIRTLKDL